MAAGYTHTTRADGLVLTHTIYNADHQNHIDNGVPLQLDDYSTDVTQMRVTRDPYPAATESLATTLGGELASIRYVLEQITNSANWYIDPTGLDSAIVSSSLTSVGTIVTGVWNGTSIGTAYTDAKVTSVSGSTGAVSDGDIDHDSLGNFAANEHFTQANITATGTVASGVWQGTAVDGTYVDLEGTELKSTGEGGGTKFLREDGDGTSSWQTPSAHTPEGTAILSTGEGGGTKFLREDGDGTCSWQAAAGGIASVAADGSPQLGGFLDANGNYVQTEKGGDIASASPLVIDTDGDYFDVTGTTNFAAMTVAADRQFTLQFDGALTMTHHATNLDLPGEANITTAAGDVATFQSTGSNTVQCISYVKADGTAVVSSGGITLGTEQASTSGTAIDFTGIPAGTKKITIMFDAVSTDGTNELSVQIGDAGGFEVSGYQSTCSAGTSGSSGTTGFLALQAGAAVEDLYGSMVLSLENSTAFTWVSMTIVSDIQTNIGNVGGGSKSLTAELTQVRITTTGTPDTFDAGVINIQYE